MSNPSPSPTPSPTPEPLPKRLLTIWHRLALRHRGQLRCTGRRWKLCRTLTEPTDLELLTGAVARGWCHPENISKEMDTDLAEAIIDEVLPLLVRARG